MKNKLIINIVLVYFAVLAVVLVVQLKSKSDNNISTEPLKDNVTYSDVLNSSIVLCDRSPVMLARQKQLLVNSENSACVPVIENNTALVPIGFFKEAFDAAVSFDRNRNTASVRLENKAMVIDGEDGSVSVVSASGDKDLGIKGRIVYKNGTAYIPLVCFAKGFDRELTVYDNLALISAGKLKLEEDEIKGFTEQIKPQVQNLPSVDEQKKLEELLGSGAVNIFNAIGENITPKEEKIPAAAIGFDAKNFDGPGIIKSDGEYIYFVRDNKLNIVSAKDTSKVLSSVETDMSKVFGIYASGRYISVVGNGNALTKEDEKPFSGCLVTIYDTQDKTKPVVVRQTGAEGEYVGAHKIGDSVYMLVKKDADSKDDFDTPEYYDSANKEMSADRKLSQVHYVPEMADKAYTSVLCFNAVDMARAVKIYTLLGCGENVTVSGESLYIAVPSSEGTTVYKLGLEDGVMTYGAAGYAEGTVMDSTCMNEYNGVLRLAASDKDNAQVLLLDEKMDKLDSVSNINPDGKIITARFVGSRGYLVTDNEKQPVYVLDLKDGIKELGKINIPDGTQAVRNFNADNFLCIKNDGSLSMLNIANMDNQMEIFTTQTGGVIDTSNLLLNTEDKVLAVDVELNSVETTTEATTQASVQTTQALNETAANVYESTTEATTEDDAATSDTPVWQGMYVYGVDMDNNAFVLKKKISHSEKFSEDKVIDGLFYSKNRIYTLSDTNIKSDEIN